MTASRSLKSANFKWLVALLVTDLLFVVWLTVPGATLGATLSLLAVGRVVTTVLTPVAVLLLVNVLPHDAKSALVYWRPLGVLPGCEAFTKLGPADQRINMEALKKKLGALPTDPRAQNETWFHLFKEVKHEPEIEEAHRLFLLYRDMAVLSILLVVLAPVAAYYAGAPTHVIWLLPGGFAIQYLAAALSARWSGERFVANVLAVQSARVARPRAKTPRGANSTKTLP
jgi:hypothetical protein